jgi:outer membrane receptor protein involved in Fe transport
VGCSYGEVVEGRVEWDVGNFMPAWRSPDENYSLSAYVRNVSDNRYITSRVLATEAPPFLFTPTQYDPRTFGVILNARF